MRIALVHDWLDTWRGGENVLAEILRIYPDADLFALVDFLPDAARARLSGQARDDVVPAAPARRPAVFPRAAAAVSARDRIAGRRRLRPRDLELARRGQGRAHRAPGSCTSAIATRRCATRGTCATSISARADSRPGLRGALAGRMLDRLRDWDRRVSARVTHFVANSEFIAQRIARCYGREATVIYPPVDVRLLHARRRRRRACRTRLLRRRIALGAVQADGPHRGGVPRSARTAAGDGGRRPRSGPRAARRRAERRVRRRSAAGAPARAPARRARVRVRRRGGFRHPAGRGAGLRHAGDRVRPRRRARDGARAATRRRRPGCSSARRRPRRSPLPCAHSTQALPTIRAAQCRANAERFSAERFRAEFAAFVGRASRLDAKRRCDAARPDNRA